MSGHGRSRQMKTVDLCLAQARAQGLARLDAQLLLAHVLGRPRVWLMAHGDDPVDAGSVTTFEQACEQRSRGVPVAYLLGGREFHGLWLDIGPGVLDPRPDTEVLVDWALACLAGPLAVNPRPRVADLGTGSGAIALAVKAGCPRCEVWATDRSERALEIAAANASRLELPLVLRAGSWFDALSGQRFDLIVSNPPYLAESDPHLAALHAEPTEALVAGPQGLDDLQTLAQEAHRALSDGGWLLLEHGADQGEAVAERLWRAGFEAVEHRRDLAGHVRCTGGQWRGTPAGS